MTSPPLNRKPGESRLAGYEAVEALYHAYFTGLLLTVVTRCGTVQAAQLVYRTFRSQALKRFLPGLEKLGLSGLPDAVAAAQYHYHSNLLGGVKVEYAYESDRKAWVRYPPPRWIFAGTAICGVPSEVSRAMLRGWHSHNGVLLRNPRLGFVCTGQTVDGQPGLEGYFYEYDNELSPEERLRFAPGERGPAFDAQPAPRLEASSWPPTRRSKVRRNYAMEYVRTVLPESMAVFGPADGGFLTRVSGQLIGMQYHDELVDALGIEKRDASSFAEFLTAMGRAQGEDVDWEVDGEEAVVHQRSWRLMQSYGELPAAVFDGWNGLWEGALSAHSRSLVLEVPKRPGRTDESIEWRIRERSQG